MSFILDALKKSETERQQNAGGEFSNVPSGSGDHQSFRWLWILGLLLLVNVVVLLGILLRPGPPTEAPAPVEQAPVEQPAPELAPAAEPSFEEQIAEAKQSQPAPESVAGEPAPGTDVVLDAPAKQAAPASPRRLMTIDELRLNGTLQLPELHLDIHVYADDPAERFVFINMKKHRENSQLPEGPVVAEITNAGVVLKYRGLTFLLPRE
ncbi:MAG: general secretion pathway protein GspB [Woeseiaceae bacterium]|jgi:general secretion pathway protein B